ncbi:MAG: exodeoxyribonuclease VII small subunit [Thermoleophilia bacterium]|nr:exodeoxyribonuclease VII small subunit [Thermoleophilia bacterium]
MTDKDDDLTFDAALERLDAVVARMESGDVGLEEAVELFERGQRYLDYCLKRLQQVERRIEELAGADPPTENGENPF